jgi:hypothetical protein
VTPTSSRWWTGRSSSSRYEAGETKGDEDRIFEVVEKLRQLLALRDALDREAVTA